MDLCDWQHHHQWALWRSHVQRFRRGRYAFLWPSASKYKLIFRNNVSFQAMFCSKQCFVPRCPIVDTTIRKKVESEKEKGGGEWQYPSGATPHLREAE